MRMWNSLLPHSLMAQSLKQKKKEKAKNAAEARWSESKDQKRHSVAGFTEALTQPDGLFSPPKLTKKKRRKEMMKRKDDLALDLPHRRTVEVAALETRLGRPPAPTPALRYAISSSHLLPKSYLLSFLALMMKSLQLWAAMS
jgi:hypothetical protein